MMNFDGILELDLLLPLQYFRNRRRDGPEHRLMIAVIVDALECIAKYRIASDPEHRRLYDEAVFWFLDRGAEWPYSFECICTELDLDSASVRERLAVGQGTRSIFGGKQDEDLNGRDEV
jgi:hypothetical protein